jgi:hypothetical protein
MVTLRASAMVAGSWDLTDVGPTLAMVFASHLPWHCTINQFLFVHREWPDW